MLGAVILNYCTGTDAGEATVALLRDPEVAHVVVVDNASPDASVRQIAAQLEILADGDRRRVTVVARDTNDGYSRGNNVGIKVLVSLGCDTVLVMNPDVRLVHRVAALVESLSPTIAIACPVLLRPDRLVDSFGGAWDYRWGRGRLQAAGMSPLVAGPPHGSTRFFTFSGACFVARCDALTAIGLLPESHFLYGEEVEVTQRLHRLGMTFVVRSDVVAVHDRGASIGSASDPLARSATAVQFGTEAAVRLTWRWWRRWLPVVVVGRLGLAGLVLFRGRRDLSVAVIKGLVGAVGRSFPRR